MSKRKAQRKDKTIPTLDDVVLKKTSDEDPSAGTDEAATSEQIDSHETETKKAEPAKTKDEQNTAKNTQDTQVLKKETTSSAVTQPDTEGENQADSRQTTRRVQDRRVEDVPLHSGESNRRVSQRRKQGSQTSDRVINAQLDPLIEKILKEMIPDLQEHIEAKLGHEIKGIVSKIMPELQQHMRMQLRFEIDKHMSKILKSGIDADFIVHPDDEY